jgi:tetratricopeptide (TPR) repeat protein
MPDALNRSALILAAVLLTAPAAARQPRHAPVVPGQQQGQDAADARKSAAAAERVRCLSKAESSPDFAFEDALAWEKRGGGADARLCQALALLNRGDGREAAQRLEALVPEMAGAPVSARAGLWNRAGWGWLQAGEPDRALAAYGQAIKLRPEEPDLRIDRALALAGVERYWDAIEDLDAAIRQQPGRAEAYVYRAQSLLKLSRAAQAETDLGKALGIDPAQPDALLLRGTLRAQRGNEAGARSDWEKVAQAGPDTDQGRAAAENLARLDEALKADGAKRKR